MCVVEDDLPAPPVVEAGDVHSLLRSRRDVSGPPRALVVRRNLGRFDEPLGILDQIRCMATGREMQLGTRTHRLQTGESPPVVESIDHRSLAHVLVSNPLVVVPRDRSAGPTRERQHRGDCSHVPTPHMSVMVGTRAVVEAPNAT